ncbi:MAG: NADH-quinone oxidoreductase subunit NuoI [Acidiferrobacter sp.]
MTVFRAIGAIGVGFWTTLRQLWQPRVTCSYPEEAPILPRRWRGRPVLTRDPDGDERCVACQLCSAVCPTRCIALQAGERRDGRRYAVTFRINFARCIYCGLCEEACPTLAIQLSEEFAFAKEDRGHFVYEKDRLLIDGTGKHPHYNFYRHSGVAIAGKGHGEGLNEMAPVDLRSNLP